MKLAGVLTLMVVLTGCTLTWGQAAPTPTDPAAHMFAQAVRARDGITYEGRAAVRFTSTRTGERLTRFHVWHDSGGSTRWEYFGKEDKVTSIAVQTGERRLAWRPDADTRPQVRSRFHAHDSFENVDLILENYRVLVEGDEPVAGRQAARLRLHGRFGNRPPTRVWVDTANLMILKEVRYDLTGRPQVERFFEEIRFPSHLDPERFAFPEELAPPTPSGRPGQQRSRPPNDEVLRQARTRLGERLPLPVTLPAGFQLGTVSSFPRGPHEGARFTLHLGYTDGLAVISVFVQESQPAQPADEPPDGPRTTTPKDEPVPVSMTYKGIEITDVSRQSRTVLRREANGLTITLIGEIDRTDLLDTLTALQPEVVPAQIPSNR